jgi:hypothetical protein
MMKIDDLLGLPPALRQHASLPEMDPLTEDDALQEAQVLDVRFDALAGVVGSCSSFARRYSFRRRVRGFLSRMASAPWRGPAQPETRR